MPESYTTGESARETLAVLLKACLQKSQIPEARAIYESIYENPDAAEAEKMKALIITDLVRAIILISQETMATPTELPPEAPALYQNREEGAESPVQFLKRVWKPWLTAGLLYQFHVGKLDPQLLHSLKSYCYRYKVSLSALLPPKSAYVLKRKEKEIELK